jgi:hypothetical protein
LICLVCLARNEVNKCYLNAATFLAMRTSIA